MTLLARSLGYEARRMTVILSADTVRADLGLDSVTTDPPDWCALAAPS